MPPETRKILHRSVPHLPAKGYSISRIAPKTANSHRIENGQNFRDFPGKGCLGAVTQTSPFTYFNDDPECDSRGPLPPEHPRQLPDCFLLAAGFVPHFKKEGPPVAQRLPLRSLVPSLSYSKSGTNGERTRVWRAPFLSYDWHCTSFPLCIFCSIYSMSTSPGRSYQLFLRSWGEH